jgi:hypothetical protein
MAKIYPDTNRFIDFYRAAIDRVDVFDELMKYKSSLVLTQQTVNEFRRNRVSTLNWLATQFKKSTKTNSLPALILQLLPAYKELADLTARRKKQANQVLKQ